PLINFPALLEHPVLDIDLLVGIPGERDIHTGQHTVLKPALPLYLIQEVRGEMLIPVEKPSLSFRPGLLPLAEKSPERRNTRSRSDHYDRRVRIHRQLEAWVMLNEYRQCIPRLYPLGKLNRANPVAVPAMRFI